MLRDENGSVAIEGIFGVLTLFAAVLATLFVFTVVKTGASGPIDNRTVGRNAAVNESCSRSGAIPNQPGTIGKREHSLITITCTFDYDGETALEFDARFRAQMKVVNEEKKFENFNAAQEADMQFNSVHVTQTTVFLKWQDVMKIITGGRALLYDNSAFIPGNDTWLFHEPSWAEGHDKVIWDRLTDAQQELFPNVYPSALDSSRKTPSEKLKELYRIAQGSNACTEYVSMMEAEPGTADLSKSKGEDAVLSTEYELFDASIDEDQIPTETDEYYECTINQVGTAKAFFVAGIELEGWIPDVELGFRTDASLYRKTIVRFFKNEDRVATHTFDIGNVEAKAGVELSTDDPAELEAGAALTVGSYEYERCKRTTSSNCLRVGLNIGKVGGELELSTKDGLKTDVDVHLGSASLGGSGKVDIPLTDRTLVFDGEGEVGITPGGILDFDFEGSVGLGEPKEPDAGIPGTFEL